MRFHLLREGQRRKGGRRGERKEEGAPFLGVKKTVVGLVAVI